MGSSIVRNLGITYISKTRLKFWIKKISKSAPENFLRHVPNWFFQYPWSHGSVRIHWTDGDLISELCKSSPVRPKHSTRTTAGVACCAAAPEPVAGFISGNCVTIGVKSPPSEFQRFPRFNPSPNERPSRSALAPSSWLMACGLFSPFSRQTLALPYLTWGSLKLQKGPSL